MPQSAPARPTPLKNTDIAQFIKQFSNLSIDEQAVEGKTKPELSEGNGEVDMDVEDNPFAKLFQSRKNGLECNKEMVTKSVFRFGVVNSLVSQPGQSTPKNLSTFNFDRKVSPDSVFHFGVSRDVDPALVSKPFPEISKKGFTFDGVTKSSFQFGGLREVCPDPIPQLGQDTPKTVSAFNFNKDVSLNPVFQFGVSPYPVQFGAPAVAVRCKNRQPGSRDGKKKQDQRTREWLRRQKSVEKEENTETPEEEIGGTRKKRQ